MACNPQGMTYKKTSHMPPKRICLVSPGHVASNPRLVKEANSLYAAGFQVRVVAGDYMEAIRPLDQTILETAPWTWCKVGMGTKANYFRRRLVQEAARKLTQAGGHSQLSIATWAYSVMSDRLAAVAAAEPADLYIAHNLAALPAAAKAAYRNRTRFGFDAEDFHTGELLDTPENQTEISIRDRIERTLLPLCHHLTAASPLIADAYQDRYGVVMRPILNVFPLSDAVPSLNFQENAIAHPNQFQRIGTEPSLYWFSQTIGSGRGLETIIQAMGKMQTRACLHLRGIPAAGYKQTLMQLAREVGIGDRLHFLPSAPPAEMIRLAAYHDIGLSLELTEPLNRAICLTNKIFVYLLAGIPVVMSETPAQEKLSHHLGEAAMVIGEDPSAIAAGLDRWLADLKRLEHRRKTAWELGQRTYNWDVEQHRFLDSVAQSLA
jgi:glycosyltransferase involved in cell wall biosynthesis